MKIAIVNQHFHIGGVETFMLSLIRQFMRMGHEVDVFLIELDNANVLIPELKTLGATVGGFGALTREGGRRRYDVTLVTNPQTLFETLRLLAKGGLQSDRLVLGAYQTRMYVLDRGPLNYHNRLTRQVFGRVPASNVIFGNDACREEHAKAVPTMAAAPVIPLIVDGEKFPRRPPFTREQPLRVVSIGRLDHFKTYNITMPAVIRRLRDQGHDVVWDVYGTGPLDAEMRRRASEQGVSENVRLLGNVSYSDIPAVLQHAFAFVGTGLSMMEAAACGVPSLPAIEYSKTPDTFGFVQDIDGISFFEPGLPLPRHDIGDKLAELIDKSGTAYEAIGDAGRAKMSGFFPATVARRYVEVLQSASPERPTLSAFTHGIYWVSAALHRNGGALLRRLRARKR